LSVPAYAVSGTVLDEAGGRVTVRLPAR
jgi:hypothetical protein